MSGPADGRESGDAVRTRRAVATVASVAVLVGSVLVGTAPAGAAGDGLGTGTVQVADQEVPVLATFALRGQQDDTTPEVRGVVHGVRRVDGGTALYYSLGAGGEDDVYGFKIFRQAPSVSDVGTAWDVRLVDPANLMAYRPLRTDDGLAVSPDEVFDGDPGMLHVGYAVFPELPADVTSVQVVMPNGTAVGEVAVEDGALAPVSQEAAPRPGEGWPELPDAAALATADVEASSYVLTRRSSDLAQEVLDVGPRGQQSGVQLEVAGELAHPRRDQPHGRAELPVELHDDRLVADATGPRRAHPTPPTPAQAVAPQGRRERAPWPPDALTTGVSGGSARE